MRALSLKVYIYIYIYSTYNKEYNTFFLLDLDKPIICTKATIIWITSHYFSFTVDGYPHPTVTCSDNSLSINSTLIGRDQIRYGYIIRDIGNQTCTITNAAGSCQFTLAVYQQGKMNSALTFSHCNHSRL